MMKYLKLVFCLCAMGIMPAVTVIAQQPPAQADAAATIQLDLDNTDLHTVVRIIADALDINYIIDPTVKGTVNVSTFGTLQRSDLLPILEAILKLNGATSIRTGNFYQIVPAGSAVRQPLTVQDARATSPDDQIVLQIVRMRFVAAAEMAKLLTPYVSDGGNIGIHETGNILLISDRGTNLRKLLEIVDIFDTNAFEGERIQLLTVKNALARDIVDDLKTIFSGYALSEKATAIRFVPFERTNQVLVITPNPEVLPEVQKWLERLDQPLQTGGLRTFIYKAKHSRALDLQKVLVQLYGRGGPVPLAPLAPPEAGAAGAPPPAPVNPLAGQPQAAPIPAQPGVNNVIIVADEINNALVVQATQQTFSEIELALRELDVLRRQVLIDAQIYEVSLDDSISFGISAILQNRGSLERSTTASFVTAANAPSPSLSAQTFAYIGRTRELLVFLNAQENRTRVRTVSAPSVLVSDNLPAEFQVGSEIPVPTSSSVSPVQSEGSNLFAQTIQFRNTGVILKVKPQINDGGSVTLEILQEVSQAGTNNTSGIVAPVIGKSSVTSTVVIGDGQTIALGGFIRENLDQDRSRVPLIGRVPIIGALFGNTSRSSGRSELIILITPHVLETYDDAVVATEELKTKLREIKKILQ